MILSSLCFFFFVSGALAHTEEAWGDDTFVDGVFTPAVRQAGHGLTSSLPDRVMESTHVRSVFSWCVCAFPVSFLNDRSQVLHAQYRVC